MEYLGKYQVSLAKGGTEEGDWWYTEGYPVWKFGIPCPKLLNKLGIPVWKLAKHFNDKEHKRRKREERYEFTSVNSYLSTHYEYSFGDYFKLRPFPEEKPHYE